MINRSYQQGKNEAVKHHPKPRPVLDEYRKKLATLMKKGGTFTGSMVILDAQDLTAQEKILMFYIMLRSQKYGYCFANNKHLSQMIHLGQTMLSDYLTKLEDKGYIICKRKIGVGGTKRTIFLNYKRLMEKIANEEHKW